MLMFSVCFLWVLQMRLLLSVLILCLLMSCSNTTSNDTNNENGEPVDIFQAIRADDTKALKRMLAKPHDLGDLNIEGIASLMLATRLGHFEMIEALLDKGANIYYRVDGRSAADLGVNNLDPKVSDLYKVLLDSAVVKACHDF